MYKKHDKLRKKKHLPVTLKAFKAINIQNPNLYTWIWILPNRFVNLINKPKKASNKKFFQSYKIYASFGKKGTLSGSDYKNTNQTIEHKQFSPVHPG